MDKDEQIVQETDRILGKGHEDGFCVFKSGDTILLTVRNSTMVTGVSGYVAFNRDEALDICRTILSVAGLDSKVKITDCEE